MSNYISKRGYIIHKSSLTPDELVQLRRELTVTPNISNDYGGQPESYSSFMESENKIHIPVYYGLSRYGAADDRRSEPTPVDLHFAQELRDYQRDDVHETLRIMQGGHGCILAAYPGYGKTVSAYYLMSQLRVKTLILVHKEFLLNQWVERARAAFPSGCSIGRIQGDTFDIDGRDVVIATIQSLSMKTYDIHAFDSFGLVVIDECHHISSKVFSRCLFKIASRYMLGLSGTPNRSDGMMKVFQWHISDRMVSPPRPRLATNCIRADIIQYHSTAARYCQVELNFRGKPSVTQLITQVVEHRPRTLLIVDQIRRVLEQGAERQILVLSERRRHLTDIFEYVREQTGHISAYYLGGMKQRDLDESTGNRVILATMSMAQEALDIPSLNTLILATSKGNVIQAVGRVLRRMNPDCYPWIIDIADVFSVFRNQMMRRIKYYKQMQFRVVTHHFNEGSGPGQGQSIDLMRTTDDVAAAASDYDDDADDESDTDPYADDFR